MGNGLVHADVSPTDGYRKPNDNSQFLRAVDKLIALLHQFALVEPGVFDDGGNTSTLSQSPLVYVLLWCKCMVLLTEKIRCC